MSQILNVPELFGSDVFNEAVMKQRLPMEVYKAWENCIQTGSTLPLDVALSSGVLLREASGK